MAGGLAATQGARDRYADGALALLLLAIVGMMIVPLPTPLLDVLIAANLALSLLMLLVAMFVRDGLAFGVMPTVLLVTTLYRLALNVSSTRLILLQADAGEVIRAFGDFVVRGNYAVGGVIFLILTLIQYVVVARGAERVAEVGARFTLDAMPGKQMAIDGDLRSGAITPEGARLRRRELERESQFYGAMDGAMKFVKGDAIAGIVITAINIVAGVGIGVGMRELGFSESLSIYGLLTIGDGLVSQLPSLVVSVSAGVVVTRVAARDEGASLGREVASQLFGNPRVLILGAGFLALLAVVPGLPFAPFALLALMLGAGGVTLRARAERSRGGVIAESSGDGPQDATELGVELGAELAASVSGPLQRELEVARAGIARSLGLPLPPVRVRVDRALPPRGYQVSLSEVPLAAGQDADAAHIAGELQRVVRRHAADLLGIQETQALLDRLAERYPALVQATVPHPVPLPVLAAVLARLVGEGVSIRPLRMIVETLAREAGQTLDPTALTERVRRRLSRQINLSASHGGVLSLHPLDLMIEEALRDGITPGGRDRPPQLALPPEVARDIVEAARDLTERPHPGGLVLLTQPDVRPLLRELLEPELPEVTILSYPELAPDARIERLAPLRLGAPPGERSPAES
ncbi:MAG: flagellar biosynthesis protein FlhA [Myxococcales bacterium]